MKFGSYSGDIKEMSVTLRKVVISIFQMQLNGPSSVVVGRARILSWEPQQKVISSNRTGEGGGLVESS